MKKRSLLLLIVVFFISASGVFAASVSVTGYGANAELTKTDVVNKAVEKIKKEVFRGNVPHDVSFDGIEEIIEFSPVIRGGSSNEEYKYRMVGTFDSDKAIKFLSNKTDDEVKQKQKESNNTISMNSNSASVFGSSESETNYVSLNGADNKDMSMSDFMADYTKQQEALNKLQEERRKDEAALREKEARTVRLSWGIGLNVFFPINTNSENIVVSNRLAPTASIGMVIKNRLIISLGVSPTFAQRYQKDIKKDLGMKYYKTYMDLNVSYKADWNSTFLYIGVGAGLDVDNAKEIYIMPQVAFSINFKQFRPVFDSAQAKIAVRYTFSTGIWDLGVEFTLQGLY